MQVGFADFDIAIVGLGPVGAVAANLAGAAGLRTLVIERGAEPYLKPRAIVFDAEIMRIFESIGLATAISQASRPLEGSIYLGADRQPIRTFRARPRAHELAWYPSNLFYQPQLERILREGLTRFDNVTVLREHDVTAVRQSDGRCTLSLLPLDTERLPERLPIEASARFVLACDGASSTIRKVLGIALEDIGFEERWLVLDALVRGPMRWPSTHAIPEEVRSGRYSLMVCDPVRPSTLIPGVGEHRRWEYMVMSGERDEDVVGEQWLREQLSLWIDPDDVEIVRAAVYRFRALIAQRWRDQNIFLVGDAAHQTPPFYGQGMCHGIRDAAQLMWRLRLVLEGVASPAALDGYQIERQPHVREIIAASVAAGAAVCKLNPTAAKLRDAEFRRIEAERGNATVAMTDVVPPIRSGLIDPHSGGMRLPEFAYATLDGSRHRLDELLAGRFTVLGSHAVAPALPAEIAARWRELDGQEITVGPPGSSAAYLDDEPNGFAKWLDSRQAQWVVVRPDRYIYAFAADRPALARHIEQLSLQLSGAQPAVHDARPSVKQVSLS
jgi:3-(3-hydroxy-phenyl)propionate hydroxylase